MPPEACSLWQLMSQALDSQMCINAVDVLVTAGQSLLYSCSLRCAGTRPQER